MIIVVKLSYFFVYIYKNNTIILVGIYGDEKNKINVCFFVDKLWLIVYNIKPSGVVCWYLLVRIRKKCNGGFVYEKKHQEVYAVFNAFWNDFL